MPKPKILLLFCGGTISMTKNAKGALVGHYGSGQLFEAEPRVRELADFSVKNVFDVDSTNMGKDHWEKLVAIIAENYSKYDGFVITTGTNTMAYASSALSFALPNIGKPVVLTGAQIPAEDISSDAHNNFVNAIRVATMNVAGVLVVFGSKIILGCRAKKVNESELEAFRTFNSADVGDIRIHIKINKNNYQKRHVKKLVVKNGFDDRVVSITLVPGLKVEYLTGLIDAGVKGIILRGYGSGDVPYELLPALKYARSKKVPVVVTTQCPNGATAMGVNDPGLKALQMGAIPALDMSMEAMSTKLMWALQQKVPYGKIKKLMNTNLVGEVKD